MGKAVRQLDDDGLPIPVASNDTTKYDSDGLPIPVKKKDAGGAGSPSPSDSSPNSGKMGKSVNILGSNQHPDIDRDKSIREQYPDISGLHDSKFVDSVLDKNKDKNFVQRYLNPATSPVIKNDDGSISTHRMASSDDIAYPTIVQQPDGSLKKLNSDGPNNEAYKYAIKNNEYIKFKNEKDADWFATNGYKLGSQNSQSVGASGSDSKQVTANYKNNNLTPKDIGDQPVGDIGGPSPEQLSHGVNNKGKNLSAWQNDKSDAYVKSLVSQHQALQKRMTDISEGGSMYDPNISTKQLSDQEQYLRGQIQKEYNVRKEKVVPELLDHLKSQVGVTDWTDAYNKPDEDFAGIKIKSPIQFNPETHTLTPKSVEWVAKHVDDQMNQKGDIAINAQVSGNLDKKDRTYSDITKSVVDYLNTIPVQKKQKEYTDEFIKGHPALKDALEANKSVSDYFSKDKIADLNAKVNIDRDKSIMTTAQKYFGKDGIAFQNKDFVGIQEKYAQLVGEGKMTQDVAKKQIDAEAKQNPSTKKIYDNYQDELRKIHEKTQKDFEGYMVDGLKGIKSKYTVYKDGSIGLVGMDEDKYKNLIKRYEGGLSDIALGMGMDTNEAWQKIANDKAKRTGAFGGSFGGALNDLTGSFSKFMFNKTQWGAKNVQYYEAQDLASPAIEQSQVAASWNWKGLESLKDPNFWMSKAGSMVPVIAGTAAVGLATDGAGMPEYVGWLANAGMFTAQSGLSTYNQMLNTRDAQGNLLTEADASHYMAEQMSKDFLPNLMMMAATSGTLLKAKNIVKPTLAGTVGRGVLGAAEAQPFFTWQGYNDYATAQESQGKKTDFWDYMQSKDFRDNLVNGMIVGGGLSLLHAPGTYMKSMDNWTKLVHTSEGEFKNLIPQNYALGMEMSGNGNYLRDALKIHVFNVDPEGLNEEGKRNLADLKNTLLYSTNLDRNIRQGNLDPKNVKDLYQAHNLALADQHDYLSEQAAKEGNKSLSNIYSDKAKDYREQAKAASNGEAKYHYLINDEGHPIFMSDKSFKTLEKEGTIAKWMKGGTIKDVHKSDDPEFAQRYKDFVTAKDESTVEGTDIMDHAKGLIEENKDKLGVYYAVAKDNPEQFYKDIADQVFGRNADGSVSLRDDAEVEARTQYGDDIVDAAKLMFPEEEAKAEEQPEEKTEKQQSPPKEAIEKPKEQVAPAAPEDKITVSEMLDKPGTYKGQRGTFAQDGQVVIFKTADGRREYELGNANEIGEHSIKDYGIEQENSVVGSNEKGNVTVRGKEYMNNYSDPLAAINYDKDGNVISVNLETPEGEKRAFRGNVAEDVAYQIHLKQISNEQPAFEQFINEDPGVQKEIDDARLPAPSEEKAASYNEPVQREKIEPAKIEDISSPKTESDEKAEEAKGREKLLNAEEGPDKSTVPPAPPEPKRVPKESPKEEFTSVRKEKNKQIKGAKALFERQKVIKWTETYDNALANLQAMYPDKGLYDAMKSRVGEFVAKVDNNEIFNPTSEDIAVFGVFKNETRQRMLEITGWDSNDPIKGVAAAAEFKVLENDLYNIARITNPGGESGRAFGMLQSEVFQDPEEGLKLRRMKYSADRGGKKLTSADLEWTAEQWEKERAILNEEHQVREKGMQDKFDKEMAKVKSDYEKRLKEERAEKKPESGKEKREKLLKEKGAELAAKIRKGKDAFKGATMVTFPGLPQAVNFVLESLAQIVEKGATLAQAIDEFVKSHQIKDKDQFQRDLFEVFDKRDRQEETYAKIGELAKSTNVTDVTKDMVGKNLIKDYIDSHVGLHDPKDVLDIAHTELQKILPDLEKDRLREAYLKQGDFKQPTKKELESGFKQSQKNFERLTAIEKDIADLTEKGELFKKSNNKPSPYDKDIEAKEKEKKGIMDSMGIKTGGEDKYKKASYDQRAKSHNDRLSSVSSGIQDKLDKGGLSDKAEKALIKLKNQLDAAKITLDPNSAISQERTLDGGIALLKGIASEFNRDTDSDIAKVGDIRRGLQKVIDGFGSDKDKSEQDVKLQRAKDKAKKDADTLFGKISRGEYEDNPVVELTKTDAELIKLERQRGALEQLYKNKRLEYERANKSPVKKWANLARGAMVTSLIWKPFTLAKVAVSALTRPAFEAATKLSFGKAFEALPMDTTKAISARAKAGGESNSVASIKKGYEAYFRQYSPKQLEEKYTKANDAYEKADKSYIEQKAEVERVKYMGMDKPEYATAVGKMNELKNVRDAALTEAIGNSMYQFIGGSSMKEALEVLLHRSTTMERQFGDFEREDFNKKNKISAENLGYVMNFVGRSHATLKNFSARFSFAAGFMARIESAIKNDIDVSSPDKILELAHESYHNWEQGKYQDSNWISDAWTKATTAVENIGKEGSKTRSFGEGMAYLLKSDVAITRVPVNMLREGILEYTLGAVTAIWNSGKEYYKAKGIVLQDGITKEDTEQFRNELREQLQKMDPEKAAAIVRAFRKGGFGLGLYSLALLGHVAFGGWAHKGQTAEDAKKTKRDADEDIDEIKTGEIRIGDWKMPEMFAKIAEHSPVFAPLGFGLGLAQVYGNNITEGLSTQESALNSAMAQVNHITGSIPQIDKVLGPLAVGAAKQVLPSGQWDDVDQDGNPMKRKAFHISDYLNYLPGFDKKGVLSENYYKQAVGIQKDYREQITEIEINTSLTPKEKSDQRKELLDQMDSDIKDVYIQNKENPQ